jgi:hypothetical protein
VSTDRCDRVGANFPRESAIVARPDAWGLADGGAVAKLTRALHLGSHMQNLSAATVIQIVSGSATNSKNVTPLSDSQRQMVVFIVSFSVLSTISITL